jgi:hypothetical protein
MFKSPKMADLITPDAAARNTCSKGSGTDNSCTGGDDGGYLE